MAHMTQTILECDRCHEQFSDKSEVRRFGLSETGVPVNGFVGNLTDSWTDDLERRDLCENCAGALMDHIEEFYDDE